jgi:quercetin dioxygenase-like cupin family protein
LEPYKIDFESMEWEIPADGVRFKAFEQDGRKLRLVEFAKEFVEPDWCRKGHIGYILEGQMEIDFDGNVIVFGPGDGVFIPAGEAHKHKGRVLTDTVRAILVENINE